MEKRYESNQKTNYELPAVPFFGGKVAKATAVPLLPPINLTFRKTLQMDKQDGKS
jgi:hypothetical protein